MKVRFRVFPGFALLILGLFATRAAGSIEWLDAAQDGTGLIWGVPLYTNFSVFVHDGSTWKPVDWTPSPNNVRARPVAIAGGPDGLVRIVWRGSDGETHWLSQHRGTNSATVAQFSAKFETPEFREPFLFVDSKRSVWITHKGPTILRAIENAGVQEVYTIPEEHLLNRQTEQGHACFFNAPHTIEDARGHVWFWINGRSSNLVRADGFVEFDGSTFAFRTISGLPNDGRCCLLAAQDQRHLLAAFVRHGLYQIDLSNYSAAPIELPEKRAFTEISQIFSVADTSYVIARHPSFRLIEGNGLWRWRREESPHMIAHGYDRMLPFFPAPWLVVPNGLVLGTAGAGVVFLPEQGEIQQLDWKNNVEVRTPRRLFRTEANNILLIGGGSSVVSMPPWPKSVSSAAFEEMQGRKGCVPDSRGHLWAIDLYTKQIQEWDGQQWTTVPVLPEMQSFESLAVDSHDRVWIIGPNHGPYVWDRARWTKWSKDLEAFEHYLQEDPKFSIGHHEIWRVVSSGDGRALRRYGSAGSADYFDGEKWMRWRHSELPHGFPRFAPGGEALLVTRTETFELQGDSWVRAETDQYQVPRPAVDGDGAESLVARKADGNAVADRSGALWSTSQHQLFRTRGDVTTPIFKPGEPNPFVDGRWLIDVVLDCNGNVFLQTNSSFDNWVLLRAASLPR